jgi:hypothetical protein
MSIAICARSRQRWLILFSLDDTPLKRATSVRLLRVVGLGILLAGLYHVVAIAFMTPLGRSQLLFTYIVFGLVLSAAGIWLLRGDLAPLFRPSRYDVVVGLVTFIVMAYYFSWIFGKPFWQVVIGHSPIPLARMYPLVGIGFLLTFAVASFTWIAHLVVVSSAQLRGRFRPTLLSHLAALLLVLPSLRIGGQFPLVVRFIFAGPNSTSNQSVEPTAGRCDDHI